MRKNDNSKFFEKNFLQKKGKPREHIPITSEEKVQQMLNNWDIVTCKICGKKISMLKATAVNDGEYFVCRKH